MKRIFLFLTAAVMLMAAAGCKPDDMYKNEFVITEITVPQNFDFYANYKNFQDVRFSYTEQPVIKISFSSPVKDSVYNLALFTDAVYYNISKELNKGEGLWYTYAIEGNELTVDLSENYGTDFNLSLYIPKEVESSEGNKLPEDKLLVISSGSRAMKNLENDRASGIYLGSPRNYELIKKKGDGKDIYFVNRNLSYLYSEGFEKGERESLNKGQNVTVKEISEGIAKVDVYYPKTEFRERFSAGFEFTEYESHNILTGYIEEKYLTYLTEPLNEGTCYVVKRGFPSRDGFERAFLCIYPPMNGELRIPILKNVAALDEEQVHLCESISLYGLPDMVSDEAYMNKEFQNGQPGYHPQYGWSQTEYENYMNAYNSYADAVISVASNFQVSEEAEDFRQEILKSMKDRAEIWKIWIDWGYKNKLQDMDYMPDEILKRIELDSAQMRQAEEILEDARRLGGTKGSEIDLLYFLTEFRSMRERQATDFYNEVLENTVFDYELPEEEISVPPYNRDIEYGTNENANSANGGLVADDDEFIYYANPKDEGKLYRIGKDGKNKVKLLDEPNLFNLYAYGDRIFFSWYKSLENDEFETGIYSVGKDGTGFRAEVPGRYGTRFLVKDDIIYYISASDRVTEEEGFPITALYTYNMKDKKEAMIDDEGIIDRCLCIYEDTLYYMNSEVIKKYSLLTGEITNTQVKSEYDFVYMAYVQLYDNRLYGRLDYIHSVSLPEAKEWETSVSFEESPIIQMSVTDEYIFFISQDLEEYRNEKYVMNIYRARHDGSELVKINSVDWDSIVGYNYAENIYTSGDRLIIVNRTAGAGDANAVMVFDFDGNRRDWDI